MRGPAATAALLAALASAAACGGGAQTHAGVSAARPTRGPVELELRSADGAFLAVGDLRGRPLLLFLFATFDGVSQAALRPLGRFARAHPDALIVGVAVQPDAQLLVDAWQAALEPPFTTAYDPQDLIVRGASDLGEVEAVPTYVMLDAEGRITGRHVGFAGSRVLERLHAQATGRRAASP